MQACGQHTVVNVMGGPLEGKLLVLKVAGWGLACAQMCAQAPDLPGSLH